jgi:hypothetical protein
MSVIMSLIVSLVLILAGPALLGAKTDPKPAQPVTSKPAQPVKPKLALPVKDLETATVDLQENTKDLRRNITSWRKIQWDPQLTAAEKKVWRDKANTYLQECDDYNDLLNKVDAKKLPASEVSRRFLTERRTFQRELQYFRETLQKSY